MAIVRRVVVQQAQEMLQHRTVDEPVPVAPSSVADRRSGSSVARWMLLLALVTLLLPNALAGQKRKTMSGTSVYVACENPLREAADHGN